MDQEIIRHAIIGYQAQVQKIEEAIRILERQLNGSAPREIAAVPAVTVTQKPKRMMSAASRRRIAAAQKRRWKEFHAKRKVAEQKAKAMFAAT